MIKESLQQKDIEDITHISTYAPNMATHKYINQISINIKGESDNNTVIMGNFNIPIT